MKIYPTWQDLPAEARGATVALGNFDGVHLGHVHLLRPPMPRGLMRPWPC